MHVVGDQEPTLEIGGRIALCHCDCCSTPQRIEDRNITELQTENISTTAI